MFLAVAEFVGFRAGGRLPCEWLAVCFAVFWMVRRKSGWGICVLPCFLFVCVLVVLSVMICQASCDHRRPSSSFLTNSFVSCKDRALEKVQECPLRRKQRSTIPEYGEFYIPLIRLNTTVIKLSKLDQLFQQLEQNEIYKARKLRGRGLWCFRSFVLSSVLIGCYDC